MAKKPEWKQLPIEQLTRGRYQPRQHFDQAQLQELAESIKTTSGLLQPIVVRPLPDGKYEIIAGERRWRAAQLAGFGEVSCLIGHYTDEQALQASIIENINRADLNPIEEAQAYQRLVDEFNYSHEEIAAAIGKSRVAVTNSLRLLKLDLRIRDFLINRQLSEGHGKILAGLPLEQQYALAERCVAQQWSVRKLETEAKRLQPLPPASPYSDPNIRVLETALSEHIGNRVHIECEDRGGGYMKIRFNNIDELEGHFSRLGFSPEER
jgi:ParB family chromosome partitioning protein